MRYERRQLITFQESNKIWIVTLNDENNQIDVMRRSTKTGAALAIEAYAILRCLSYEIESDIFAPTTIISVK